jgi:8-oxo-dGTP pyrophosphatase MutT (NUDIX family)
VSFAIDVKRYKNITLLTYMNRHMSGCNNCGKQGHVSVQCKLPMTSYGIIVFRSSEKGIQYLMIRRKDSFGYIDFIRGKYILYNTKQIQDIINEMSITEKERVLQYPYETLWKEMWGETSCCVPYKNEDISASKKFDNLKKGLDIDDEHIFLQDFIDKSTTCWEETEWEFPKGRRNPKEKDLDCALREFEEETGISRESLKIIENVYPFEETFIGTNHKSYKNKYFLAYMNGYEKEDLHHFQKSEVSKLQWKTFEECLQSIRPYNLEKKKVITNINTLLHEYRLY